MVLSVWWRLYARQRAGDMSFTEFLEWFVLWLVVGVVAIIPGVTSWLAQVMGVGRGSDLVVYLALLLTFYLFSRLFVRLERIERNITKVVQEQALHQAEMNDGRGNSQTSASSSQPHS